MRRDARFQIALKLFHPPTQTTDFVEHGRAWISSPGRECPRSACHKPRSFQPSRSRTPPVGPDTDDRGIPPAHPSPTTAFAPTRAFRPTVTGPRTCAPEPRWTPPAAGGGRFTSFWDSLSNCRRNPAEGHIVIKRPRYRRFRRFRRSPHRSHGRSQGDCRSWQPDEYPPLSGNDRYWPKNRARTNRRFDQSQCDSRYQTIA